MQLLQMTNKYIREPGNFITHLIPAILAIGGLYLLHQKSTSFFHYASSYIYGLGVLILFGVSALYHSVPKTDYSLRIWQKLDHCCIYIMIAGSFTPTVLIIFDDSLRRYTFGLVWSIAFIGILLKIFNRLKNQYLSTALYIAMGCVVIPFLQQIMQVLPFTAVVWLVLGGIFYVVGTYFYAKDKQMHQNFHSHEVWHMFVNFGALAHFIYNYVYVFNVT